jgi:hypothetical protein
MSGQRALVFLVALGVAAFGLMQYLSGRSEQERAGEDDTAAAAANATGGGAMAGETTDGVLTEPRDVEGPPPEPEPGFESLLQRTTDGRFTKAGWNHYGPGYFTLDPKTGVLASHGGMGLFWYSAETFGDFVLRLQFQTSKLESNSGVFVRVPAVPTSDDYIYHSFEVQIHAAGDAPIHRTGAVYDAEPASKDAAKAPGEWNDMEISFVGDRIRVVLNGEQVVDWEAHPAGKVEDFAPSGYIGLQNHDADSSVWFRNIRVQRVD